MPKKTLSLLLISSILILPLFAAEPITDEEYLNRINYKNNRLDFVTKKRLVDEKRSYSYTDIDTTTYSLEAYTQTYSNVDTTALSQSEVKEIEDWYIYKGGVRRLSDTEFLKLIDDQSTLVAVQKLEAEKNRMRGIGNMVIGAGLLTMIGGSAFSAGQAVITIGGLIMTGGFFLSAFNIAPIHYIQPDYAQEKVDEYNLALKRNLNLPLNYD